MNFMRRKPVRLLLVLVTLIVLAVVAVQVFLPAEKIKDLALQQAREKLGREVSAGEVAVSLRGGLGVRIDDFTIHNPDGFSGDPLLATASLDLKLDLASLLHGEVNVTRLVIDQPKLNLVRRADGSDNFTFEAAATDSGTLSGEGATAAPPPLVMSDVRLQHGTVSFADATVDPSQFESAQILGCQLGFSLATEANGELVVAGHFTSEKIIIVSAQETPEVGAKVDFKLRWEPTTSRLVIEAAEVEVAGVPFTCTGQLHLAESGPVGDLKLRAENVACVELAAFLPQELAEKVQGDRASGQLTAVVDLAFGETEAAGVAVTGEITLSDLDLSLAQPFMPPHQSGLIAGRMDAKFSFSQGESLTYSGSLAVRDMSFRDASLVDELQSLNAKLTFTPDEIVVVESLAKFDAGAFSLTGSLRDPLPYFLPPELQPESGGKLPHLSFELSTKHLDVDRLIPVASPATTQSKPPAKPLAKKTKQLPGDFPRLTAEGVFRADSIVYMQIPLTDVQGMITLVDQQLKISRVTGTVFQGAVTGDLAVDLSDINDPAFTGHYELRDIEVDEFISRFVGLSGVLFGRYSMSGDFSANGLDPETVRNSLSLDAAASLVAGRLITTGQTHAVLSKLASQAGQSLAAEQSLRELATHISVSDGRVSLEALETRLGQFGDLSLDGYYGFDGEINYSGQVLLTAAQTERWFDDNGLLSGLGDLMGGRRPERLLLPLAIGGTREKPQLKIDFAAVTKDMQQRVIDEQGEKLTDSLADQAKKKLGGLFDKWK